MTTKIVNAEELIESLTELQALVFSVNESKGFHNDRPKPMRIGSSVAAQKERQAALANWQGNKLLLIVSEIAEAQDEIRNGHAADETYYPEPPLPTSLVAEVGVAKARELISEDQEGKLRKPEGVPSEIADVVIRCFDFAATEGFNLGQIIAEKIAYNSTRPFMHGKKF
ncbi:hypothetical protein [Arthrobacter sp. StoSoilB22]|uniref:hypothetical protein n=1 Tax=Arthrobacter sp. StoSoilB22 TaxID=2830996 RepID=UPI001CC78B50|nr:hypothetical protein [Arthrobacter sp. StoSoilB22]BCW61870.1 hypothetical protein StoSoilB22_08430 [Arthrobacter sp. StoSoilB22]